MSVLICSCSTEIRSGYFGILWFFGILTLKLARPLNTSSFYLKFEAEKPLLHQYRRTLILENFNSENSWKCWCFIRNLREAWWPHDGPIWLLRSTPERAVRVLALAGDIVLCWARHFTLTAPHSTQVYKWAPANCWGNLTNFGGVTGDGLASRPGEVEILLAASCYWNQDKLQQLRASLGSKASLSRLHYSLCYGVFQ